MDEVGARPVRNRVCHAPISAGMSRLESGDPRTFRSCASRFGRPRGWHSWQLFGEASDPPIRQRARQTPLGRAQHLAWTCQAVSRAETARQAELSGEHHDEESLNRVVAGRVLVSGVDLIDTGSNLAGDEGRMRECFRKTPRRVP